jgi:hypothetical protein
MDVQEWIRIVWEVIGKLEFKSSSYPIPKIGLGTSDERTTLFRL